MGSLWIGNYAPDAHFDEIAELGTGYIGAVFPLIGPQSDNSPIGIPPPPVTAAADFLVSILSSFGLHGGCRGPRRSDIRAERSCCAPTLRPAHGRVAEQGLVHALLRLERRHWVLAR